MRFDIGMENNVEGRSLAWALDHPGCFAYGDDSETAFLAMQEAITAYARWITRHRVDRGWLDLFSIKEQHEAILLLVETWDVYTIDQDFDIAQEGYEVNAWFRHDWKPLTSQDVERALSLLGWSREDLLESVKGLSQDALDARYPGERWSIAGILQHVGGAEWWYLDRLNLAIPKEQLPVEPHSRLQLVRDFLIEALPTLVGLERVVGVDGEFWSPRKLLRRAIWHERDHTQHILKLRS